MPRDQSPESELSPLERTALWVQAQAALAQAYADSTPPSPARSSTKTTSTYRTTTSTDDASFKPALARSSSMQHSTRSRAPAPTVASTQRPRYDSRNGRRSSLPFPQSPPGSGYPVRLEIVPPPRPESEDRQASSSLQRPLKQRPPTLNPGKPLTDTIAGTTIVVVAQGAETLHHIPDHIPGQPTAENGSGKEEDIAWRHALCQAQRA